ncbi:Rossmann-fold NAD(P)-binding domain-containing protein [Jiangella rhizosphaerae]|uniref:SDR family NAD(P)-dependent oxidoreductase n=1 Tax=Jiangella rhizosphaerae TaxID=2293569 RepID=A0A418KSL3_9ACTN|nr:hypothetical protein [Jiangella rhizosphaerae]RIQ26265.1 hypothetical protein DY240_10790 [Jiangella rhizosphaerae]
MTRIDGTVAIVTGGNRDLGKVLVDELFARGAAKVYAAARDPRTVTDPRAMPLAVDVRVLVNNGGGHLLNVHSVLPWPAISGSYSAPKSSPADVVRLALDAVEAGAHEGLADDVSRRVKAGLSGELGALYPQLAAS